MKIGMILVVFATFRVASWGQDLPSAFDLRDVEGANYSTAVKSQTGGTCWTYGTMAAIESNLLMTGVWAQNGESGEPNLAEYHLDWWNGFNQHHNDDVDPPDGGGLEVHMGGDYRVSSAYIVRGDGAVRDRDGQTYSTPPERHLESYHYYYPRHVEWFIDDLEPSSRDAIKEAIRTHGAIGTCMYWGGGFYSSSTDSHYQPPADTQLPNHAITIIGWDDSKVTQCATSGAWLCKNSWGATWSGDGHFWISYYDKHCCKEPEMGAVSFRDVQLQTYLNIYYHDTHGWRDTVAVNKGLNAFIAQTKEDLVAVSFFTAGDEVDYEIGVYRQFSGGQCNDLASMQTGHFARTGFHTVNLDTRVYLDTGQSFYIVVELSQGGQAYDCTSEVPVLLGPAPSGADFPLDAKSMAEAFEAYSKNLGKMNTTASAGATVVSSATAGESLYWDGGAWIDLTTFNSTANFCIKGLTAITNDFDRDGIPDETDPDDDNDKMPDDWEILYSFNPRDAGDGPLDADFDCMTNFQEWVADTHPLDPTSVLRTETAASGNLTEIHFKSSVDRLYTLLYKNDLRAETWNPVTGAGPRAGVNGPDVMTDPTTDPPARRFYRLRVDAP